MTNGYRDGMCWSDGGRSRRGRAAEPTGAANEPRSGQPAEPPRRARVWPGQRRSTAWAALDSCDEVSGGVEGGDDESAGDQGGGDDSRRPLRGDVRGEGLEPVDEFREALSAGRCPGGVVQPASQPFRIGVGGLVQRPPGPAPEVWSSQGRDRGGCDAPAGEGLLAGRLGPARPVVHRLVHRLRELRVAEGARRRGTGLGGGPRWGRARRRAVVASVVPSRSSSACPASRKGSGGGPAGCRADRAGLGSALFVRGAGSR